MTVERHHFAPSGNIPNSELPLLLFKGGAPVSADGGRDICRLYEKNGWSGTWVYTVYKFWHFHTLGHEALTCVAGGARIGFGGDDGIVAAVEPGDVAIVPAGVGHKRIEASGDFLMAGSYPPGQHGNIVRPGEMDAASVQREIKRLRLPDTNPITGASLDWLSS
jgi:uncharacterized protein YjlB